MGHDAWMFEEMLEGLRRALAEGQSLDEVRCQAGPQLLISEPRALYQPLEKAREVLVSELLLVSLALSRRRYSSARS